MTIRLGISSEATNCDEQGRTSVPSSLFRWNESLRRFPHDDTSERCRGRFAKPFGVHAPVADGGAVVRHARGELAVDLEPQLVTDDGQQQRVDLLEWDLVGR